MSHENAQLWYAWLIPLFPLFGFLVNGFLPFFGLKLPKSAAGWLATLMVFASFAVSCALFGAVQSADELHKQSTVYLAPWLTVPADGLGIQSLQVNFELLIDPLSVLMMLIITGVGGLIHLYSIAYMAADKDHNRFFTYLNLFIFFMLLLVMGNNLLMLFIGWEGVGLCSYLLIGYFYEKQSAGDAAKKAFIVNRIGDVGVLIGMFFLFKYFHTLDFLTGHGPTGMLESAPQLIAAAAPSTITVIMLMLFLGCTGKSAQIPLYTWLPDAMEGPTPVSALIHAATMVTAGVYLVSRMHVLFVLSDAAMTVILVIGLATAMLAATIGLLQNDIKRVLAYSTVSQLGYMFAACGAGVFAAGMYHVMTHAFFKACLFLGSGSVIHAVEHGMHHADKANEAHSEGSHSGPGEIVPGVPAQDPHDPQDMRNMGGLLNKVPITAWTMILATVTIAGILFAGYYSKDQILWRVWQTMPAGNYAAWAVGVATALMTAFYMFRLVMKTFFGQPRTDAARTAHESPWQMTFPLIVLAALFVGTGLIWLQFDKFADFLAPATGTLLPIHDPGSEAPLGWITWISVVVVAAICVSLYLRSKSGDLASPEARKSPLYQVVFHKWYVDEAYNFLFVKMGKRFADELWKIDRGVVDGVVNGVARLTNRTGEILRTAQSGFVRNYAFTMVVGILILLIGCLAGLNLAR